MNPRLKILVYTLTIFLTSCNQVDKGTIEFQTITDKQDKFEIALPGGWHKEYLSDAFSSAIISSDTSKDIDKVIIVNAKWDTASVFINPNLAKTIDSLNVSVGLKTILEKSGIIKDNKTYFNYSCGLDSLTNLQANQYLYILKYDSFKGHVLLTCTTYGDTVQQYQSKIISKIVQTIKMK
jgi:hypothetical protein